MTGMMAVHTHATGVDYTKDPAMFDPKPGPDDAANFSRVSCEKCGSKSFRHTSRVGRHYDIRGRGSQSNVPQWP